ncbi:MAG: endolytic transglycosylase MltG [Firmicutes bacterium]|mgnify:CR=1 FL=1|nr:endolytic transglycosylase MltG [Bacillota bacterium]
MMRRQYRPAQIFVRDWQLPSLKAIWTRGMGILGRLLCIGLLLGFGLVLIASRAILPPANAKLAAASIIRVSPGSSSWDIGDMLSQAGVIRSKTAFAVASRLLGLEQRLQAGDYRLSPGMDLFEVMRHLEAGRVATVRVTIPEGLSLEAIADRLAAADIVDRDRFLTLVRDDRLIYGDNSPIDKPTASLEGYLFPDTYFFVRNQPEEEIIKRMVHRFTEMVDPVLEEVQLPADFSLHEIISLASIIEKEVMVSREAPLVSAVFWNRLRIGMPLQSDPTVQYAMERPQRKLYLSDLALDSPYNTYKYRGLPPGPIASPGLASIKAALQPAEVDYLYFVAKGDGTHAFSRTFQQHRAARRRYGM